MTTPDTILLTHRTTAREMWFGDAAVAALRASGPVRTNPADTPYDGPGLVEAARGCPVVVLDRETALPREVLAELPDLVAVARSGVDCSRVDVEAASAAGVLVVPAEPGYVESTAELVLALLLSAARGIPRYARAYAVGAPAAPELGSELASSTVGVVGHGRVGRRVARLLDAFGADVLVTDPFLSEVDGRSVVPLEDLASRSDFVVLLTAATEQTRHLVCEPVLRAMRPDAWLVNCSRGQVVDEDALHRALERGGIAGVAMDVGSGHDEMPHPRFQGRDDVIATPHIGNLTGAGLGRQPMNTAHHVAELLAGRIPATTLDPSADARLRARHPR
ncbi:NAD(P)-dependent oxidoreductase [Pseudonocardia nematodicida]|uniref:NAD(P)-dependent oxidoreductase n=1 Tax=Pseudonocardia nematodicida TaxID=1206997 RepID=A0ABV1KHA5_9PSEU